MGWTLEQFEKFGPKTKEAQEAAIRAASIREALVKARVLDVNGMQLVKAGYPLWLGKDGFYSQDEVKRLLEAVENDVTLTYWKDDAKLGLVQIFPEVRIRETLREMGALRV
jgi:hypothetical protein